MILIEDRRNLAQDIQAARDAGARLEQVCEVAGIDERTLQRWNAQEGLSKGDGRPQAVRPMPSHALSQAERDRVLSVANEARFAAVPPARIVPMLADEGVYLASESTFARVLRAHGQTAHRGRARAPRAKRQPAEVGDVHIVISTITLAEVLTGPYKAGQTLLAKRYEQALLNYKVIPVSASIAALAAQLRARYRLKLPDAMQLATAIDVGASAFVTHDADFSGVEGLRILTGE